MTFVLEEIGYFDSEFVISLSKNKKQIVSISIYGLYSNKRIINEIAESSIF